jgi:hypothetical protein
MHLAIGPGGDYGDPAGDGSSSDFNGGLAEQHGAPSVEGKIIVGAISKRCDPRLDLFVSRPMCPIFTRRKNVMTERDDKFTAQNLIAVHGLRAQAVVQERIAESRQQGDTAELDRWQSVGAAIGELRRTAPAGAFNR